MKPTQTNIYTSGLIWVLIDVRPGIDLMHSIGGEWANSDFLLRQDRVSIDQDKEGIIIYLINTNQLP